MGDGSWSIAEVARMSGVTARALRHYDAVGLLPPARVAADGRRHYGRRELLRLQRILLLRELGLGLPAIADALARGTGDTVVLREHRDRLVAERARLGRLVRTVEDTIGSMEGGADMAAERMFEGFEHAPYESEARDRWGDEVVDESWRRLRALGADDAELARTGYAQVHEGLAPLLAAGVPVTDPRAQELVGLHHRVVSLFWEPTAEAYRNLGRTYAEDDRYGPAIGDPALVGYLRDAMAAYAETRLR